MAGIRVQCQATAAAGLTGYLGFVYGKHAEFLP
jgi:hypothetical protein